MSVTRMESSAGATRATLPPTIQNYAHTFLMMNCAFAGSKLWSRYPDTDAGSTLSGSGDSPTPFTGVPRISLERRASPAAVFGAIVGAGVRAATVCAIGRIRRGTVNGVVGGLAA